MVSFRFSAQGIDPTQGANPLPNGEHVAVVTATSLENNAQQTGGFLKATITAIDGAFKGQSIDERYNLHHEKSKTVEIAQKELAALCAVVGRPNGIENDTQELHNIPFIVVIGPQKDKPQYSEVKQVKFTDGTLPGANGQRIQPTQNNQQPQGYSQPVQENNQPPANNQQAGTWGTNSMQQPPANNVSNNPPQNTNVSNGWGNQGQPQQQQPQQQPVQNPPANGWVGNNAQPQQSNNPPANSQPVNNGWNNNQQPQGNNPPAGPAPWGNK